MGHIGLTVLQVNPLAMHGPNTVWTLVYVPGWTARVPVDGLGCSVYGT